MMARHTEGPIVARETAEDLRNRVAPGIRKMIYTTNPVEALHWSLRKIINARQLQPPGLPTNIVKRPTSPLARKSARQHRRRAPNGGDALRGRQWRRGAGVNNAGKGETRRCAVSAIQPHRLSGHGDYFSRLGRKALGDEFSA
jgi:hypothetical protein